jgi:hypothetical protein
MVLRGRWEAAIAPNTLRALLVGATAAPGGVRSP